MTTQTYSRLELENQIKLQSKEDGIWTMRESFLCSLVRESIQRIEQYQGTNDVLFQTENRKLGRFLEAKDYCRNRANEAALKKDYFEWLFLQ